MYSRLRGRTSVWIFAVAALDESHVQRIIPSPCCQPAVGTAAPVCADSQFARLEEKFFGPGLSGPSVGHNGLSFAAFNDLERRAQLSSLMILLEFRPGQRDTRMMPAREKICAPMNSARVPSECWMRRTSFHF